MFSTRPLYVRCTSVTHPVASVTRSSHARNMTVTWPFPDRYNVRSRPLHIHNTPVTASPVTASSTSVRYMSVTHPVHIGTRPFHIHDVLTRPLQVWYTRCVLYAHKIRLNMVHPVTQVHVQHARYTFVSRRVHIRYDPFHIQYTPVTRLSPSLHQLHPQSR